MRPGDYVALERAIRRGESHELIERAAGRRGLRFGRRGGGGPPQATAAKAMGGAGTGIFDFRSSSMTGTTFANQVAGGTDLTQGTAGFRPIAGTPINGKASHALLAVPGTRGERRQMRGDGVDPDTVTRQLRDHSPVRDAEPVEPPHPTQLPVPVIGDR